MSIKFLAIGICLTTLSCQNSNSIETVNKINSGQIILSNGKFQKIEGFNDSQTTTYIIVRHAEKDTLANPQNPPLSEIGKLRANHLAELVQNYPIAKAYYTSRMSRTYETVLPILNSLKCPSDTFNRHAIEPFFLNTLEAHKGQTVLIVGNTNTIPKMLNCFELKEKYKDISESEFDNIFIVAARSKNDVSIHQYKY